MPIDYAEMQDYPQETQTPTGFRATRKLMCKWEDRFALGALLEFVEYPYKASTGAYPVSISAIPQPGGECLGDALDDSIAVYEKAIVTIEYSTPEIAGGGALFEFGGYKISESIESSTEFLTIDPSKFQWGSGTTGKPVKDSEAPGRAIRGWDWVYQKFNVGPIDPDILLVLPDTVNSNALSSPSLGFSVNPETLYFHAPAIVRKGDNTQALFDLSYRFSFRRHTWNKFWRAETNSYEFMYLKGTSTVYKPFELGNFNIL